jgi:hypothetical protein
MPTTQPRNDTGFINWASSLNARVIQDKEKWKLNEEVVGEFSTLVPGAVKAYEANSNPMTKNHQTVAMKNDLFKKLRRIIARLQGVMRANLLVTDGDLVSMGFPSRHHQSREPLPAPEDAPELTVITGQRHEVILYGSVPLRGHPVESVRKKKSYHGLVFRYRVEGNETWEEKMSTRLKTILEFEEEQAGKYLHVTAAWFNPRLERGPWGDEITVLVN